MKVPGVLNLQEVREGGGGDKGLQNLKGDQNSG